MLVIRHTTGRRGERFGDAGNIKCHSTHATHTRRATRHGRTKHVEHCVEEKDRSSKSRKAVTVVLPLESQEHEE